MAVHTPLVKPEKIAATAVGMLEQELGLVSLFRREGFDQFKYAKDDAVNLKVEGFLPGHTYKFRGDRDAVNTGAEPHEGEIKFDTYSERTIQIKLSGVGYSAVTLTDEQNDFDDLTVQKLMRLQSRAVARMVNHGAVNEIEGAPYEVVVGGAERNLRGSLTEARRVLNRFNVGTENRLLIVGSDFETALLEDDKITLAQNVGDSRADTAIGQAVLGSIRGFTVVLDQNIDAESAFAMVDDGFILANAASGVPNSVPFGANASYESLALRWMRDYDLRKRQDQSLVDTYYGFRPVKDLILGYDETLKKEFATADEHFVRGIKLSLTGDSVYPEVDSDLDKVSGVSTANSWPSYVEPVTEPTD